MPSSSSTGRDRSRRMAWSVVMRRPDLGGGLADVAGLEPVGVGEPVDERLAPVPPRDGPGADALHQLGHLVHPDARRGRPGSRRASSSPASNRSRIVEPPRVAAGRGRRAEEPVEGGLHDPGLAQRREHGGHEAEELVARPDDEDAPGGQPAVVVDEPGGAVEADHRLAGARARRAGRAWRWGRAGRARPARTGGWRPRRASRCRGCATARRAAVRSR